MIFRRSAGSATGGKISGACRYRGPIGDELVEHRLVPIESRQSARVTAEAGHLAGLRTEDVVHRRTKTIVARSRSRQSRRKAANRAIAWRRARPAAHQHRGRGRRRHNRSRECGGGGDAIGTGSDRMSSRDFYLQLAGDNQSARRGDRPRHTRRWRRRRRGTAFMPRWARRHRSRAPARLRRLSPDIANEQVCGVVHYRTPTGRPSPPLAALTPAFRSDACRTSSRRAESSIGQEPEGDGRISGPREFDNQNAPRDHIFLKTATSDQNELSRLVDRLSWQLRGQRNPRRFLPPHGGCGWAPAKALSLLHARLWRASTRSSHLVLMPASVERHVPPARRLAECRPPTPQWRVVRIWRENLLRMATLAGVLGTATTAAVAIQEVPKSGTTPYTTHFLFVPKSTVDIPVRR